MKPPKFKMTELGPIPEDWGVREIGDIASVCTGNCNTQDKVDTGKYPFYVRSPIVERINEYGFDTEGVITVGDGVGTGKVFHYVNGKFALHQRCYLIDKFCPAVDGKYFFKIFSARFYDRVMQMTAKSSVDSVRREMITGMLIPLPPLAEQRRIAGALSDVDELISALGKLIEKKRNIKTGTMQQLLTGKRRLQGFGGAEFKQTELGPIPSDWEVKRLGEIASVITKGTTPTSVGCEFEQYGINFIKAESISDNGAFLDEMFAHISERTNMFLSRSILKEDDYLFSIAGVLGRVALVPENVLPANTNQALAIIRLDTKFQIDKRYLLFALKSGYIKNRVKAENVAAAQANLSLQDVSSFHIALPTLPEQRAIAAVLSDMDAEIAALEAEQAKYARIKSGMMQQLLTGKTRLR